MSVSKVSKPVSPLCARFIRDMRIRGLRPRTIESYVGSMHRLTHFYKKSPELLTLEEINRYQDHLSGPDAKSWAYYNITMCGIRFFYRHTVKRDWDIGEMPFAKRREKMPVVLSQQEVRAFLDATDDLKYKAMFMVMYSAGLRLFETCKLKITDIDSDRMVLAVRDGKGGKDRYVELSRVLLLTLREHWRQMRVHGKHLFPAKGRDEPITHSTVQKKCQQYMLAAGITKRATPHTLRHSFATHMIENGENLLKVQQMLGHSHLSTVLIYLHCAKDYISKGVSPLDLLYGTTKNPSFSKAEVAL